MIIVTAGAREPSLGPRGVNGGINELLFPLRHGTLLSTGMAAVPPFVGPTAFGAEVRRAPRPGCAGPLRTLPVAVLPARERR